MAIELDRPREPGRIGRNPLASGPAEACQRCGVRADVGCKHRPAAGPVPPAMDPRRKAKLDRRFRQSGT